MPNFVQLFKLSMKGFFMSLVKENCLRRSIQETVISFVGIDDMTLKVIHIAVVYEYCYFYDMTIYLTCTKSNIKRTFGQIDVKGEGGTK